MRIHKDFSTVEHFERVNKGLRCRAKCARCEKAWKDTNTKHVHRAAEVLKQEGRAVEVVHYLCDGCLETLAPVKLLSC